MKLTIPYNVTSFLTNLSTFGWKGTFKVANAEGANSNRINANANSTTIVSESIITLQDYLFQHKSMSYELVEQMILHLGNQMILMSDNHLGLLFFKLDSVLLLDNAYFLIADLTSMVPLNSKEQLTLNYPLKMEGLLSPELVDISTLPVVVSVTSSYYSLGLLCMVCLGLDLDTIMNSNIMNSNIMNSNIMNSNIMNSNIMNSKMYFFLQRCLQSDPNKRYFLYI